MNLVFNRLIAQSGCGKKRTDALLASIVGLANDQARIIQVHDMDYRVETITALPKESGLEEIAE